MSDRKFSKTLDVTANRKLRKWSSLELFGRLAWRLAWPLFGLSPRPVWGWRRWLLRLFGAEIGKAVHIHPTVRISVPWNLRLGDQCAVGDRVILYALGPITVGARATVSQGAHLCAGTHDWRKPNMPLLKLPIAIGAGSWICADAFVGPGVTIGEGAIIGARAVAMKDVPDNAIVVGNPGIIVSSRAKDT